MKRAVWKYELKKPEKIFLINGFKRALTAQLQGDVVVLWVIANADEPTIPVKVRMVETGCRFDGVNSESYINTIQMLDGSVVHVFAEICHERQEEKC